MKIRRLNIYYGLFVCAAVWCTVTNSMAAAGDDYYNDWWLCAQKCVPGSVGEIKCLDACTDDFNRTHYTPQREDPPALQLRRSLSDSGDNRQQNYVNACPKGTTLTPFPMPIYDDDGLFVIDFRTVWFCLPADLEPAG